VRYFARVRPIESSYNGNAVRRSVIVLPRIGLQVQALLLNFAEPAFLDSGSNRHAYLLGTIIVTSYKTSSLSCAIPSHFYCRLKNRFPIKYLAHRACPEECIRMLNGKRIIVVMPAYNAAQTIEMTYREIPSDFIDHVVLVDDASHDQTYALSQGLGIDTLIHPTNLGYGGNQKTCYRRALELDADVVVMLHPDYQYTPRLLVSLAAMVAFGEYDIALGSRMLCGGALKGECPNTNIFRIVSSLPRRMR
jgi:hypothetical protein